MLTLPLPDLKATALLKLVYLEMLGYDMSWASFHVLEVMSSPKYHQKRVGYLGAVQSFRPDTEVLMLATNLLKKASLCRCDVHSWYRNADRLPRTSDQRRPPSSLSPSRLYRTSSLPPSRSRLSPTSSRA